MWLATKDQNVNRPIDIIKICHRMWVIKIVIIRIQVQISHFLSCRIYVNFRGHVTLFVLKLFKCYCDLKKLLLRFLEVGLAV